VGTVAPAKQIMDVASGKRSGKEVLAEQVGMKLHTDATEAKKEKFLRRKKLMELQKEAKRKAARWSDD
jgi:hypothetical protein